jgi:hypothetical protein
VNIAPNVYFVLDQSQGHRLNFAEQQRRASLSTCIQSNGLHPLIGGHVSSPSLSGPYSPTPFQAQKRSTLPDYVKPLPQRIVADDVDYLYRKGALSIPEDNLRNELLRSYIEYMHSYMPILDLHDFLRIISKGDGSIGRLSLLLVQSVMFAGTAFVDMKHLQEAGYESRKAARKAFFLKARVKKHPQKPLMQRY